MIHVHTHTHVYTEHVLKASKKLVRRVTLLYLRKLTKRESFLWIICRRLLVQRTMAGKIGFPKAYGDGRNWENLQVWGCRNLEYLVNREFENLEVWKSGI